MAIEIRFMTALELPFLPTILILIKAQPFGPRQCRLKVATQTGGLGYVAPKSLLCLTTLLEYRSAYGRVISLLRNAGLTF